MKRLTEWTALATSLEATREHKMAEIEKLIGEVTTLNEMLTTLDKAKIKPVPEKVESAARRLRMLRYGKKMMKVGHCGEGHRIKSKLDLNSRGECKVCIRLKNGRYYSVLRKKVRRSK